MKKIGDLLGISLFAAGIWILTVLFGVFEEIGFFAGLISGIGLVITQGYVVYEKWFRRKKYGK